MLTSNLGNSSQESLLQISFSQQSISKSARAELDRIWDEIEARPPPGNILQEVTARYEARRTTSAPSGLDTQSSVSSLEVVRPAPPPLTQGALSKYVTAKQKERALPASSLLARRSVSAEGGALPEEDTPLNASKRRAEEAGEETGKRRKVEQTGEETAQRRTVERAAKKRQGESKEEQAASESDREDGGRSDREKEVEDTNPAIQNLKEKAIHATQKANNAKKERRFRRCACCGNKRDKASHPANGYCPWHPLHLSLAEFDEMDDMTKAQYSKPFCAVCRNQESDNGCRRLDPSLSTASLERNLKNWYCCKRDAGFSYDCLSGKKSSKRVAQVRKMQVERQRQLAAPASLEDLAEGLPIRLRASRATTLTDGKGTTLDVQTGDVVEFLKLDAASEGEIRVGAALCGRNWSDSVDPSGERVVLEEFTGEAFRRQGTAMKNDKADLSDAEENSS